jgi:hypothetical protein
MIRMPWNNETAPNVMLEVTDACNLQCTACYKKPGSTFKTLDQVRHDLDTGAALRPLHTVTISGGEPTLHPDLPAILSLVKQRGVHVFLLTNGLNLHPDRLHLFKASGLDSILFHVDAGQNRPDLPPNPGFPEIQNRLSELVSAAAACGLDVSVSATLYGETVEFLRQLCAYVFSTPEVTFLFLAKGRDPRSTRPPPSGGDGLDTEAIQSFFESEYGVEPFAYIPSQIGPRIPWLSFFVPIAYRGRNTSRFRIRSNWADLALMAIPRLLRGRYIHKTTQHAPLTLLRTAINAATTFRLLAFGRFLVACTGARLAHKMIVYDDGPVRLADGRLDHCLYCPTAIVRDGALLPCCTADYGPRPPEASP